MRPSSQISDPAEVDLKTGSLEVIAIGQARAEKELTGACVMRKVERHEGGVCQALQETEGRSHSPSLWTLGRDETVSYSWKQMPSLR